VTAPLDLDAIEARAEAATEGPWQYDGMPLREDAEYGHIVTGGGTPGSMREHQICWVGETLNLRAPEDAEFIAHARVDVPALLAEVERLRAAVRQAFDAVDWNSDGYNPGVGRAILRAALTPDAPDGAA
jgi:hypothetical protein